ncbi:hypothetical protein TYRP_013914 [Tyrophagus putrescentiae]|nr:hypothetical protein TYRP_013914 [Tyrophagus putrescentiae]
MSAKRAGPEETEVDSGQVTSEIRDKEWLCLLSTLEFNVLLLLLTSRCSAVQRYNRQFTAECARYCFAQQMSSNKHNETKCRLRLLKRFKTANGCSGLVSRYLGDYYITTMTFNAIIIYLVRKPEKFETFSSEFSDFWFVLTALRMLVLLPLQPQRSRQPVSASLSHTAAAAALGCRESTVMRGQCTVQGGEV